MPFPADLPNLKPHHVMPAKSRRIAASLVLIPLAFACARGRTPASSADPMAAHDMSAMPGMSAMAGMSGMDAPVTIPPGAIYTVADVHFMQGMIAHHAQAIFMSRLAAEHNANARLQRFATKIDQSQTSEIRLMQEWLHANGQFVPDTSSYHTVMMPGMLDKEQVKQLEAARGAEFDRQFLVLMIQHHQGALKMVEDLFASPRAGQDVDVSVFANDVVTVQTAEIGLMYQMLSNLSAPAPAPEPI